MMKQVKTWLTVCALLCVPSLYAQLPMGGWQTFFNYNNVSQITLGQDKVYALSDGNLFSVDKKYGSIETYTKLNGLSDGNISHIAYCADQDLLVIAYENCNIDLLKGYQIINLPDLKQSEVGSKKINSITIQGKYAYFACGFGIMEIDLAKYEVADSYIIGDRGEYLSVKRIAFCQDTIYALTTNDIRCAAQNDKNLSDFSHWQVLDTKDINKKQIKDIYSFNNTLLVNANNTVFKKETTMTPILDISGSSFHTVEQQFVVSGRETTTILNTKGEEVTSIQATDVTDIIYDSEYKNYWVSYTAQDGQTLLHRFKKSGEHANHYIPEGPFSTSMAFIKRGGNILYTGSGGPFDLPSGTAGIVQIYENNQWSIISESGMDTAIIHDKHFRDVLDLAVDPIDPNHIFVASWQGIFEFNGFTLTNHYNEKNSPLEPNWINILTDAISFDKEGNMWVANMLSQKPIIIYTKDHQWVSYQYTELQNTETIKEVFLDSKGYLWVLIPRKGTKVFCADLNNTPLNYRDDRTKILTSFPDKDGHIITPTTFRCIAEDQDGVIWIGSDKGPLIISDQSKVFKQDFVIDRIKITREDNANYADYLLENEQINAIAIDGNNRKWVATSSSGLYLLSADGKETIHHFTTENSPFTSNAIMDLAINNETGELYIVTSNALFLYKSDAVVGSETYRNVYAYPNPVRENYDGPITISGLMENSQLRIADSQGRIIHQGESNGGAYVWDGKDLNGRKVDTGVYFIFAAQQDGSSKMVTKIAIIK